jgi:hypothetical protein
VRHVSPLPRGNANKAHHWFNQSSKWAQYVEDENRATELSEWDRFRVKWFGEEQSFGASLVPVAGSLRQSVYDLSEPGLLNKAEGIGWAAVAVSDVFLVRSLLTGGTRLAARGLAESGILGGADRTTAAQAARRQGLISRYLAQGFNLRRAGRLAEEYSGEGHHLIRSNWRFLSWAREFPLFRLSGRGMSQGEFYELHYLVDQAYKASPFAKYIGGSWRGSLLELEKYGFLGRVWYGSPMSLKLTVSGAISGSARGLHYWFQQRE